MKSKLIAQMISAIALAAGCEVAPPGERAITQGFNPAFSPDGAQIAFQRLDGDQSLPRRILFPTRLVERDSV